MLLMPIRLFAISSLVFIVGCAPQARLYNVSVKNDTANPITVNLTKDGPPVEEAWASPEDIAGGKIKIGPESRLSYQTLQPGKTQGVHGIPGQFDAKTHAILRVYRGGDLQIRDMLKLSPGLDRQDVVLGDGDNRFIVRDAGGKLSVGPAQ